MNLKVTILGCGGSLGVPELGRRQAGPVIDQMAGGIAKVAKIQEGWAYDRPYDPRWGNWGDCDPANPKNRRLRPSIFIESATTKILVDTSPDLKEQLLRAQIDHIDAVVYTHGHADHLHGIDDLRGINRVMRAPIPIHANHETLEAIERAFGYALWRGEGEPVFRRPVLAPHLIKDDQDELVIGDIKIQLIRQDHNATHFRETFGFRIGNFAYSTDAYLLSEEAMSQLRGLDVWVVGCLRRDRDSDIHANLPKALGWIEELKPKQSYFTHMNLSMDYDTLCAELPPHIRPAYDGMIIEID